MKKGIIVLIVILAILVAGYFLVDSGIFEKKEPDNKAPSAPVQVDLTITNWTEPASSISLKNQSGEFTFQRKGTDWFCAELPTYPISGTRLSEMAAILGGMTGTRQIKFSTENMETFGLNDPIATLKFKANSTAEETLVVGKKNQATTDYYVKLGSKNAIYMMQSQYIDYFLGDSIYYVDIPELPDVQTTEVSLFRYKSDKGTFELSKLNANNSKHYDLTVGFGSIYLSTVETPYTEDMAKYGLDDPNVYTYVEYKTTDEQGVQSTLKTFELKVGDICPDDENYRYAVSSIHPNAVYRMFTVALEGFTSVADLLIK